MALDKSTGHTHTFFSFWLLAGTYNCLERYPAFHIAFAYTAADVFVRSSTAIFVMYITFVCCIHVLLQYRHFPVPANSCLPRCIVTFQYEHIPPLFCAVFTTAIPTISSTCQFCQNILTASSSTKYSSTCHFTQPCKLSIYFQYPHIPFAVPSISNTCRFIASNFTFLSFSLSIVLTWRGQTSNFVVRWRIGPCMILSYSAFTFIDTTSNSYNGVK